MLLKQSVCVYMKIHSYNDNVVYSLVSVLLPILNRNKGNPLFRLACPISRYIWYRDPCEMFFFKLAVIRANVLLTVGTY